MCPDCDRTHAKPYRPLTPTQERVARLLAQGQSRGEIALALRITEGTVQMHLNHIAALLPTDELTPRDRVLVWAYWEYRAA